MMRRSASAGCWPFMLASMTRRQTAAVASSLKSLAASSTVRAVSSAPPSCCGASDWTPAMPPLRPKPCGAALPNAGTPLPNGIPFMLGYPLSSCVECGRHARVERRGAVLAGLVESEHAARGFAVKPAVIVFESLQVTGRDAVVLGAKEQERHGRIPGETQRVAQDQQHFPISGEQNALDHVSRQRGQQRHANDDLIDAVRKCIVR